MNSRGTDVSKLKAKGPMLAFVLGSVLEHDVLPLLAERLPVIVVLSGRLLRSRVLQVLLSAAVVVALDWA